MTSADASGRDTAGGGSRSEDGEKPGERSVSDGEWGVRGEGGKRVRVMTVRLRPVRSAARRGRMVTIRANARTPGISGRKGRETMSGTATEHRRADAGTVRLSSGTLTG